jgi:predicted phosphodiesterase
MDDIIDQYDEEDFSSRLEFARFLHEKHPEKSIKGWEMTLIRQANDKNKYRYNAEEDLYVYNWAKSRLEITGEKHRSMITNYTNGMRVETMAVTHDLPIDFISYWRRTHSITRGSIPLASEELFELSDEDSLETIAMRRRVKIATLEVQKRYALIEKDAIKWRELEKQLDELKGTLEKAPKTVPKLKLPASRSPYALVVCPTDFHWGKHGWSDEVGETYNFEEARKRLMEKTEKLVERIAVAPEKIYVGAGSDWFHVDNDYGTTTKGTAQDMCGSPAQILITGCQLAREHIDLLRQVAPVEVVMMAGNHDRHSTIALMMYLSAAYEGVEDVTITISPNNRRYFVYGDTLLGFTHGDGLSKKISLPALMSVEAKREWGITDHRVWFHGHLHHQRLTERDGCLIIQMPSLAGHDRYHARAGYTTSTAGLAAYMIDKREGYIGSFFAPVSHED